MLSNSQSLIIIVPIIFVLYQLQRPKIVEKTVIKTVYKTDTVYTSVSSNHHLLSNDKMNNNLKIDKEGNIDLKAKVIPSESNTFGYDIILNGRTIIHQTNIPGMPGNKGFDSKDQAQMVGDIVIRKLIEDENPPFVAYDDLINLGALN